MMKMRKLLKKTGRDESGFTLIELMVVVVILGILAAMVLPRIVGDVTEDAEDAAKAANKRMLQTAVDRYATDNKTSVGDWDNATMKTNLTSVGASGNGPYVDDVPTGYYVDDGIVKEGSPPAATS